MSIALNRTDRFKQSISSDIQIECCDGRQLAVNSKLLLAHSNFFKTMIDGKFEEGTKFSSQKCLSIPLTQISFKTMTAVACFFTNYSLPEKTEWTPEELITLNESLPFFQLSPTLEHRLRNLLITEIKTNQLCDPEKKLSWYAAGLDSAIHFPGLKEIALESLKGPFTAEEFLSIIRTVSDSATFTDYDSELFLENFVPKCAIIWEDVTPRETQGIYQVMSRYGTNEQKETCVLQLAPNLTDEDLFSILNRNKSIDGITPEDARGYCLKTLSKRIPMWFKAIENNCQLDLKSAKIRGNKEGLFKRVRLDQNAKANLEQFAKLAPSLAYEQSFHLELTHNLMPVNLHYWVKAQLNRA